MKHTIYYKDLLGRDTRAVLRELAPADQNYIKTVMTAYKLLALAEPRPEFAQWFDRPNERLPKFKERGLGHNSPRTWTDGILDKLNQAANRRDLSPVQCEGIEVLSRQIEEMYPENECAYIEFKNKTDKTPATQGSFGSLFRK